MFSKKCCSSLVRSSFVRSCFVQGLAILALLVGAPKVGAEGRPVVPAGGEVSFSSVQGPVSLGDLRGKVVLLFFGYTSCPDICPLSLARIGAFLSTLDADQAQHVGALFVTLDPGRDTAERMHRYAGFFHPAIIGLTGETDAIDALTARYGVTYERKSAPESALGYTISHPDTILLVDADGALADEVQGNARPETLGRKVLGLLERRSRG